MVKSKFPKRSWAAFREIAGWLNPDNNDLSSEDFLEFIHECEETIEDLALTLKTTIDIQELTATPEENIMCVLILNAYMSAWLMADLLEEFGETEELIQKGIVHTCHDYPLFIKRSLEKVRREKEKLCKKEKS